MEFIGRGRVRVSRWMRRGGWLGLFPVMASLAPASAETLAYWRFEEGTSGQAMSVDSMIQDSSGHNNLLRVFSAETAPSFSPLLPFSMVPRTGEANAMALDNTAPPGGSCLTRDLFCVHTGEGTGLNDCALKEWTIEASVLFKEHPGWQGRWQTFVGRDGYNVPEWPAVTEDLRPAFCLRRRVDTQRISVETYTDRGQEVCLQTLGPVAPEVWVHVAAISNGRELSLFLWGPQDQKVVLQGTVPFKGALFNNHGCWSVGRGCFANVPADQFYGLIDEVRLSDKALAVKDLLASPGRTDRRRKDTDAPAGVSLGQGG